MSSILTNNGAMVALQTLKGINANLSKVQDEISTGKSVSSAKDNSAVRAISKVMEADAAGFKTISDSLALGESTVAVGRQAAESVTDLLTQMKDKIVSAQQANVDKTKIQADISALRDQIKSVVGAAQFNGQNLVNNSGTVQVLASLDRDANGVTPNYINVTGQDLSTGSYTAKAIFSSNTATGAAKDTDTKALAKANSTGVSITLDRTVDLAAGDSISIAVGDQTVSYTLSDEDAAQSMLEKTNIVAVGLKSQIDALGITDLRVDLAAGSSAGDAKLTFKAADTNGDSTTSLDQDVTITSQFKNAGAGGLGQIANIDVNSDPAGAMVKIEAAINTSIDAAAAFGTVQNRVTTQSEFVSRLTDSLKNGIGSLVDADMEETSAKLQALQVQQQLGVQSLSIANQAPQSIMSLFR